MANTTFDGPVRSRNGFQSIGPGSVIALAAATDLTVADHAGRILQWTQLEQLQSHFRQLMRLLIQLSAGPGSDPNNANTVGTTFEILFIDEFTGTISTDGTLISLLVQL